MKKFLSLLVAAVLMTTLVMPVTASADTTSTEASLVITRIDVTAPGIVEGEDPDDYPVSFTSTPLGASTGYDTRWLKVAAGGEIEDSVLLAEGEKFDKAYDYYLDMVFEASGEYVFNASSTCFVNGTQVTCKDKGDELRAAFKVDFKSDETTTVAPTQAPTTTAAATTSPQTADTMNPLFYVLAIIALAGAASVTIFARRKK